MKKRWIITAAIIGLIGLVWFGQGIGIIGGSFMTSNTKWAVIGGIMLLVAMGILFATWRHAK